MLSTVTWHESLILCQQKQTVEYIIVKAGKITGWLERSGSNWPEFKAFHYMRGKGDLRTHKPTDLLRKTILDTSLFYIIYMATV